MTSSIPFFPEQPMNFDRAAAMSRSLDGLSVGDAFGECFFAIQLNPLSWNMHLSTRTLPNCGWRWTDDTAMAAGIVEVLTRRGAVDQDALADVFARRYAWDDRRGYGGIAHDILRSINAGSHWSDVAPAAFGGTGSMGNGSAMRVAPLGAFFAEDIPELVVQATRSAQITHSHPEGIAGAVAVALAAAFVVRNPDATSETAWSEFFDLVLEHTPDSQVRLLISRAGLVPAATAIGSVVEELGNGEKVTAPDTVPYCIWCTARSLGDFEEAMWTTVSGGGDMDTNCAIVGGIVASSERAAAPDAWVARREPLPAPLT
jgi:ADP-ribosylglycohydrolase